MSLKDKLIGDYDYKSLCLPAMMLPKGEQKFQFYEKDEALPIFLSIIMGLQHALAMVGGLITPPLVIARFNIDITDTELQQYFISAALITSGICTIIRYVIVLVPTFCMYVLEIA